MEEDRDTSIKDHFPEPQKRFWMRSRKRRNSDAASVSSMDISMGSDSIKKKKRRRITEVASSFFSSSSSSLTPSKFGSVLQRSFSSQVTDLSLLGEEVDSGKTKKRSKVTAERLDQLAIRSWIVDIAEGKSSGHLDLSLSRREVKRQEAIYELFCGEDVLLRDLDNLREFYYEPLLRSDILTPGELATLFGDISSLVDLHKKLRDELVCLRDESGFTDAVGTILISWLPSLAECYVDRCKAQVWARHLLEAKRANNKRFQEFLKKRTSVPRAVDLWTYLDVPRSRVVKYPILVNEILRHTPCNHPDQTALRKVSDILSKLLIEIDEAMGNSECKLAQNKINPSPVCDPHKVIQNAVEVITEGQLRDAKGTKLHCFLFDNCFVLARPARRPGRKCNPCFPVVLRDQLRVQFEIEAGEKIHTTSFKVAEHTLNADDEHAKRHWIESFRRLNTISTNGKRNHDGNIIVTEEKNKKRKEKENRNENENENEDVDKMSEISEKSPITKSTRKLKSVGDLCSSHFPISLRKSLLRDKRNSISLV
ncbi:neuroepithelial cell-transforming gene 1 protein [Neodiprion pinetum]|uniref:neuroepithelial cell-transforming gene 1 protein n=1 Tax=Neodiprion pinetum TaxID=441929 RepID=UPI001EDD97C2|nr:neuroepithelial cell-transforming gene 1 protein-like [Neodiprion pinetum]